MSEINDIFPVEKRGPGRSPGRPRSDASSQAILNAAYELLEEKGIAGFTIEGVAARAGSAKTTIYRWWPNRGLLAADALFLRMNQELPSLNDLSAVASMRTAMHALADLLSGPTGRAVSGLIAEAQSCDQTAEAIHHNLVERRRAITRKVIEQGISRGELRPDLNVEGAMDALYGPIFARLMMKLGPIDHAWIDRLADTVFQGLTAQAVK